MKQIGPYRIEGLLGSGGMGQVYRAHDEALDRPVAIKLLGDALSLEDWERYRREARLTASVRHPHVVGVHGAGRTPVGQPYLVLDLVEGGSLHDRIRAQGKLPPRQAAQLARDLADALHAAHAQGVLHRDVKPHNVLLDAKGRALLADFGLARSEDLNSLTVSGEVVGTPAYMAPEQALARHAQVGPQTDVYGVGATLYAMLCGEPPHSGSTPAEVLQAVARGAPPRIGERAPGLDPALEALCMRCLAREPAHRFPSAGALRDALDDYLFGPRSGESRVSMLAAPRRAGAWGPLALGVLLGAAGVWLPARFDAEPPALEGELRDRHWRAVDRSKRGDHEGARDDLDQLLVDRPDLAQLWFERAGERLELKDPEGALFDLERAASFTVGDPWSVRYLRALVHYTRDEWAAAIADFDEALALRPSYYAQALVQRGLTKEKLGDGDGALADYARALEQDPRHTSARLRRAIVYFERGDFAASRTELEAALAVDPEHPPSRQLRARIRLKQGDAEGSLADNEAVLRAALKGEVEALLGRGEALLQLRRWAEAEPACELAVLVDPEGVDGYLLRGVARQSLGELAQNAGRVEEAVAYYRRSIADKLEYRERGGLKDAESRALFDDQLRMLEERIRQLGGR